MATQTAQKTKPETQAQPAANKGEVAIFQPPRLPWHDAIEQRFGEIGVDKSTWKALVEAVFPLAQSVDSVIMALSYCKARRLDPFKRVVHVVPMWNGNLRKMVDTVWPGIAELRTTAARTGCYAGKSKPIFGPEVTEKIGPVNVTFPEWCEVTVHRLVGGHRVSFTGIVFWREAVVTKKDGAPNAMWDRRKYGQLAKCAEAEALREAFPEELGGEQTAEEMHGRTIGNLVDDGSGIYAPEAGEPAGNGAAKPSDRPTRDDMAEPFVLADCDGEVVEYTDPKDFVSALMTDLEAAVFLGAFEDQWQVNVEKPDVRGRLAAAGLDSLVEQINEASVILRGRAEEHEESAGGESLGRPPADEGSDDGEPAPAGQDAERPSPPDETAPPQEPGEDGDSRGSLDIEVPIRELDGKPDWQGLWNVLDEKIKTADEATLAEIEAHPAIENCKEGSPTAYGFITKAIKARRAEIGGKKK